ncbi:hypothetical protein [Streptomyces sp. 7N604]
MVAATGGSVAPAMADNHSTGGGTVATRDNHSTIPAPQTSPDGTPATSA